MCNHSYFSHIFNALFFLIFRPLCTKASNNTTAESSEDELNGYDKVVVSQNLAEEILDEIYGKIEAFNPMTTATQVYENSVVNENGAIDAPFHLHDPNINQPKSLADEILDELYGRKSANGSGPSSPRAALGQKSGSSKKVELAVDHPYEEIQSSTKISAAADLEYSPAITGKILIYTWQFFALLIYREKARKIMNFLRESERNVRKLFAPFCGEITPYPKNFNFCIFVH